MTTYSQQLDVDLKRIINEIIIIKNENSDYTIKYFEPVDSIWIVVYLKKDEVKRRLSQEIIYKYFYTRLKKITVSTKNFTDKFKSIFLDFMPDFQSGWKVEKNIDANGNVVIQKRDYDFKLCLSGSYLIEDFPLREGITITPRWFAISQIKQRTIIKMSQEPDEEDSFIYYSGKYLPDNYNDVSSNVRFYFNINCESMDFDSNVLLFVKSVIKNINERFVPFIFKILRNKNKYNRADSAVLYVNKRHFYCIVDVVKSLSVEFESILNEDTTMFASKIGKGLGFAEQPPLDKNDGLHFIETPSFGMHRATIIADAMIDLIDANEQIKITKVRNFIDKPNLKSFGEAKYFYLNRTLFQYYKRYDLSHFEQNSLNSELLIAEKIAFKLYSESIWDFKGRCSWIAQQSQDTYHTLDTDFIEGLAGICVFLIYLFEITKKEIHRIFLEGTINTLDFKLADRYYFSDKDGNETNLRNGYYKGDLMPIYLLRKLKMGINTSNLFNQNIYSPQRIVNSIKNTNELGLWDGKSGTIIALLKLYEVDNDLIYKNKAIEIGDNLLNIQNIDTIEINVKNGTGGIILALLFLFEITQEEQYLDKAKFVVDEENKTKQNNNNKWRGIDNGEYGSPYFGRILVDMSISRMITEKYFDCGSDFEDTINLLMQMVEIEGEYDILDFEKGLFNYVNSEMIEQNSILKNEVLDIDNYINKIDELIDKDEIFCNSFSDVESKGFRPDLFHGYAGLGYFVLKYTQNEIKLPSILFPFFKEGKYL